MRTKEQDDQTRETIRRKMKISAKKKDKSLVMVFTGDGKGKTSAAVLMAFRTVAHGWKAAVVQFMKSPKDFKYGERIIAEKIEGLDFFTMGAGFTWNTNNRDLDVRTTLETWEKCKECVSSGRYRTVIWDEINYVIDYGFLPLASVVDFLKQRPPKVHIVLTGRNAKPEIVELANLVTEMKEIKHPYKLEGIIAQKGIEY
ncbi:MAG: cob(I)yrinic acid a,c-diamide adenosyltransferase [Candidatus Lindowbacteria bacterium RIFCSPLOWO2_12_FULL_62_27]|nr:MAG: cob(I)yrinic acid a,c-diamide adenosyltransferase [Candidatus Lindowbacteria bacterium RIFCSPLOWO2_02_FULL_62_12]OGH61106.1 MAG: cob(I)yrinic acid a,c-diamide adenosyltransferase [Candidatus Lindowbacteria bacterium RIFCSPLOWO2_12_FULL_62_27]